jgi:hypothetical protein
MIHFLLMLFAFAEAFLLWVLVALIRENHRLARHKGKAARTRSALVSRNEEVIPMNFATSQDENAGKAAGKRAVLMVLGALVFTLALHGQQTPSAASATAVEEGTSSDQPIPPDVMKELEALEARIAQLEAQVTKGGQNATLQQAGPGSDPSGIPNRSDVRSRDESRCSRVRVSFRSRGLVQWNDAGVEGNDADLRVQVCRWRLDEDGVAPRFFQPAIFFTASVGALKKEQNTATFGLMWPQTRLVVGSVIRDLV